MVLWHIIKVVSLFVCIMKLLIDVLLVLCIGYAHILLLAITIPFALSTYPLFDHHFIITFTRPMACIICMNCIFIEWIRFFIQIWSMLCLFVVIFFIYVIVIFIPFLVICFYFFDLAILCSSSYYVLYWVYVFSIHFSCDIGYNFYIFIGLLIIHRHWRSISI